MKISIANKKLITKPQSDLEKGKYFKNIQFSTGNFSLETFQKIIENGCTITYIYKDDTFNRSNSYMTNNYVGTEYIVVDVDKCDINPNSFVSRLKYKPTLYHTTFSNLSEQKENKWCFHLIYCFSSVIYGEDNFKEVFNEITRDYNEFVDDNAKDCHRVIFTSNSKLPNYQYKFLGTVYNPNDFIGNTKTEIYDDLDTFLYENISVAKNENAYILTTSNNIQGNKKSATTEKNTLKYTIAFGLDDTFCSDLSKMMRGNFLNKYLEIYPYINRTMPTEEQVKQTKEGIVYEDWRDTDYYEVPSKYRWDSVKGKFQVKKVEKGNRTKSLMYDCLLFIKCIPNITKEYLVTMLVNEVYKYYSNDDKEMTNYKIIGIAKYGWEMKDDLDIEPKKKTFKLVTSNNMATNKAVGVLNKLMKDEEIGEWIDLSMTIEQNIKEMKDNGIKITKKRLQQFCEDYELKLLTDKEQRNNAIIAAHIWNPSLSYRKLSEMLKEKGINVNYTTIQRILTKSEGVAKN